MKKTAIYTLLCTTILTSGISFAAEKKEPLHGTPSRVSQLREKPEAPLTPVSSLKEKESKIPTTPKAEDLIQNFPSKEYSPHGAKYAAEREVRRLHMEHQLEKKKIASEINKIQNVRDIEAVKKTEVEEREKAVKARAEELERESEQKNSVFEAKMIENLEIEKERSKQALAKITLQIEALKLEATAAKVQAESATQSSDVLRDKIQKTREQALLDIEIRDKQIEQLEQEAEIERVANYKAQVEIAKLKEKNKTFEAVLNVKVSTTDASPQSPSDPSTLLSGASILSASSIVLSTTVGDGGTSVPNLPPQLQSQGGTSTPSVSSTSVAVEKKKVKKVVEKEEGATF